MLIACLILLTLHTLLPLNSPSFAHAASAHVTPQPHHRLATSADLDFITNILITAFPMDPQYTYQFRYRLQYPEDNYNCTREIFEQYLPFNGVWDNFTINVVDSPLNEDEVVVGPVAVAIWIRVGNGTWVLEEQEERSIFNIFGAAADCAHRRDLDPKRAEAFRKTCTDYAKEHFKTEFKDRHLHLSTIATHPDYQRRGFGTTLLNWGLKLAQKRKLGISLFGSPMGVPVYKHVGFKIMDILKIQVEGEEEFVMETAMQFDDAFYSDGITVEL